MTPAQPTVTILSTLSLLFIGACAQVGGMAEKTALVCPEVSILAEGAELVRYAAGPGRSASHVLHREIVSGFTGACESTLREDGGSQLVVEISPEIASERGPANLDQKASFEYFVALTDSANRLVTKRRFPVTVDFSVAGTRTLWREEQPAVVTLPLKPGDSGEKWRIFIGLQLTRNELRNLGTGP